MKYGFSKITIGEYGADNRLCYPLPNALLAIFQVPNEQKISIANSLVSQKDVLMLSNLIRRFFANNQYGLVCSFSQIMVLMK